MSSKDPTLAVLVAQLDLPARHWLVVDDDPADLHSVAFAAALSSGRSVRVSTAGEAEGRYAYQCRIPTGPEAGQHETVARGQGVDVAALIAALEEHLPRSNGFGRPATPDDLRAAVHALVGLPCWSVVAGRGTGSVVSLLFGAKVPREQPLKNRHLTDDERVFTSDHGLFVNAAWRLDGPLDVVCSWRGSNEPGGAMVPGLATLVGRTVTACELRAPAHDLTVWFGGDRRLSIFCDLTPDRGNDYTVFMPGGSISAGPVGVIDREPRS
jgi:hypothetical protein